MAISFKKMYALMESKGINKNYLRNNGINPNMLNQLLETGNTGTKTINKLCELLDCQPGDIMDYVEE